MCPSITLLLLVAAYVSADSCVPPSLEAGFILGEGDGHSWTGTLGCKPGFILVGSNKLKCRNGQWSANMPVCTAIGQCDPDQLPALPHGRKEPYKSTQYRGAVYKYSCGRGYKRHGPGLVHCTGDTWDIQRVPLCYRTGCEEGSAVSEVVHGVARRKAHGGVYYYQCWEGSVLVGSPVIVCDGNTWNDTAPLCLSPSLPPRLSVKVEGLAAEEVLAGSSVTVVCEGEGGNPPPTLTLLKNGEALGRGSTGSATVVLVPRPEDNTAVLSCSASNPAMPHPTQTEAVLSVLFGPSRVSVGGAGHVVQGHAGGYECVTSPSNPPASIKWKVTDAQGMEMMHDTQVSDSSQSWAGHGWVTTSTALLLPPPGVSALHVSCTASNPATHLSLTDSKQVAVHFAPARVTVTGPSRVLLGSGVSLECVTAPSTPAASVTWSVTQAGQTLQHSTEQSVEQLEDGSFVTRSWLEVIASTGHDLAVECYGTNQVMGKDFQAYAHVIEILSPPGVPKISGVSHNSAVQNLTCSTSAGNPPASLSWYRGEEMMDSLYQVQGDMVMTHITFVPSEQQQEVTCEASNEALSEPIRNTVLIERNGDTTTRIAMVAETDFENDYDDDYERVGEVQSTFQFTDDSFARDDDTEGYDTIGYNDVSEENPIHTSYDDSDAVVKGDAVNSQNSKIEKDITGHYLENKITKLGYMTERNLNRNAEDMTSENAADREKEHSETPSDAVYVPSQKQLSKTHYLKTNIEVTEATETKEEDEQKVENKSGPETASHIMNSSYLPQYSLFTFFAALLVLSSISSIFGDTY